MECSLDGKTCKLPDTKPVPKEREEDFIFKAPPYFSPDSKVPKFIQDAVTIGFTFFTIHYFFWIVPALIFLYSLHHHGYTIIAAVLIALYVPTLFDGAHKKILKGRNWDSLRQLKIWSVCANYIDMELIRQKELDPKKKYIFGYHPHGIIILSRISVYAGLWEKAFPGIPYRVLGASTMFYIPLARELCLWLGAIDASRSTASKALESGCSVAVYPGGVPEMFRCDPNSTKTEIVLKKRFGFIKLALKHGADLVPIFVFGEKWQYNMWNVPPNIRAFFKNLLKMPIIVFWGKFMWLPLGSENGKRKFGVVYGEPIPVSKNENPTDEEVQKLHAQYMERVKGLFETYKGRYGYDENETLEIV